MAVRLRVSSRSIAMRSAAGKLLRYFDDAMLRDEKARATAADRGVALRPQLGGHHRAVIVGGFRGQTSGSFFRLRHTQIVDRYLFGLGPDNNPVQMVAKD
jgi:hypothetical protein